MGKSSKPSTTSGLSHPQQRIDQLLSQFLQQNFNQGASQYGGQIVPDLVPQYQQSLNFLKGFNPQQFQQGQNSAVNSLLSGKPSFQLDPQTTADWFQKSVVNPMQTNYEQNIKPQINEAFAGIGGFSSLQGTAQARALQNIGVQEASSLAQGNFSNQQLQAQLADSAANRQVQGLQASMQIQNQPFAQALGYQQVLDRFQNQANLQGQANYQDFLRTAPENNPYLSQAQSYLGHTNQIAYQNPSLLTQGLQGVASLGLLGSSLGGAGGGILTGLNGLTGGASGFLTALLLGG